jgi:hypothetical protein
MAASDPAYDPNLYSAGSVWALGSAVAAGTFWHQHRPLTAWQIWRALVDWNTLDSAGHLPEVLAGDLYHPEREAVPEQTWSSAGLLSSAVHGLLGLEVHAADRSITVAPHLPANMDDITVRHVRVGDTLLDLSIHRRPDDFDLVVDNPGAAVDIVFDPMLPLGASANGATIAKQPVPVRIEHCSQDEHARLHFLAGSGRTVAHIGYGGGIRLEPTCGDLQLGAGSHDPIISDARVSGHVLRIEGWAVDDHPLDIGVASRLDLAMRSGGRLTDTSPGQYRLTASGSKSEALGSAPKYERFAVTIDIGNGAGPGERAATK